MARTPIDFAQIETILAALNSAPDRNHGEQILAGLTDNELRRIARAGRVPVGSGWTKVRVLRAIVDLRVGRRVDSLAIERCSRGY